MIVLRSTRNCTNAPRVMFALEELGLEYSIDAVPDGTFTNTWGSPGPTLSEQLPEGALLVIEPAAIVRHLARRSGQLWPTSLAAQADGDRWIDFLQRRLVRALDKGDPEKLALLLGFLENQVGTWLLGDELTIVDCLYAYLDQTYARERIPFERFPAIAAYVERIATRPAWIRANARIPR